MLKVREYKNLFDFYIISFALYTWLTIVQFDQLGKLSTNFAALDPLADVCIGIYIKLYGLK